MKKKAGRGGMTLIDLILPPRCIVTGEIVQEQGTISPQVWKKLQFISDPQCRKCGVPFEFFAGDEALCAPCLDHPPPFDQARSCLIYNDASRDLILGFKHADKLHITRAFTPWMARTGKDMLQEADALIPVPLHRWRLLRRRYNQAAILAKALSVQTSVRWWPDALSRVRATPTQGHLKAKDRAENVRNAFMLTPSYTARIAGKSLVLIDDVFTTGSTVKECASVLKKAGAERVDVLTLARTVRGLVLN